MKITGKTSNLVTDIISYKLLDGLTEGKTAKNPVDIGDGFYLKRVGFDLNGNWSYWVQLGSNRARKIQALNVNAGANKITDLSVLTSGEGYSDSGNGYSDTIAGIKKYYNKYIRPIKRNLREYFDNDGKRYLYVIDLDERGYFNAHVEDDDGKVVYEFSNDDSEDGSLSIIEDGFMKHTRDVRGLQDYLRDMDVIGSRDYIVSADDVNRISESTEHNIKFNFSEASYQNNSDQLTYKVSDLKINTEEGELEVPVAGTINFQLSEKEFLEKLLNEVGELVTSVEDVKLKELSRDLVLSADQVGSDLRLNTSLPYTLTVEYKINDENKKIDVEFDGFNFLPSNDLLKYYYHLTER